MLGDDIYLVLVNQGIGNFCLCWGVIPGASILYIHFHIFLEQRSSVHHPKIKASRAPDDLDIGECRYNADVARLGQRPSDETFQVKRLVLSGEISNVIGHCRHITGDNGHKIGIRVFISDVRQGQPYVLSISYDDVGTLGDQLFRKGHRLIRRHVFSEDIL